MNTKFRIATLIILIVILSLPVVAGDWTINGQIRYRYEAGDKDFTDQTDFASTSLLRSRLNVKFHPADQATVVMQIQDSRTFGEELSTLTDGSADNLDLHQAYFQLDDFFLPDLSLKAGRFEAVYGPQRLIGAVGWHNIGRSFDGLVMTYKLQSMKLDLFHMNDAGTDVNGGWLTLKVPDWQSTQLFTIKDGQRLTAGLYAKGKLGSIYYEAEFASQSGEMAVGIDYAAWMGALNATLALESFKLSGGIDILSGDDASTGDKYECFSTLYATNHKYYGSMDYFLNLPVHTSNLGLVDIHVKAAGKAILGWSPAVAFHMFNSQVESAAGESDFGSELDVAVKHKYNDKVSIVGGYSMFMPGALKAAEGVNGQWAYLMTVVNF